MKVEEFVKRKQELNEEIAGILESIKLINKSEFDCCELYINGIETSVQASIIIDALTKQVLTLELEQLRLQVN